MSTKKSNDLSSLGSLVFNDENYQPEPEPEGTQSKKVEKLILTKSNKGRSGKTASIISGFTWSTEDIELLCTQLKVKCGAGGTVKANEIIIQGDIMDRLKNYLESLGHSVAVK
ncbi:MAG: translation initiation factor [Bacteroidota bacterium]|nr:translation initiation factor [Bacteroidota bacterium]